MWITFSFISMLSYGKIYSHNYSLSDSVIQNLLLASENSVLVKSSYIIILCNLFYLVLNLHIFLNNNFSKFCLSKFLKHNIFLKIFKAEQSKFWKRKKKENFFVKTTFWCKSRLFISALHIRDKFPDRLKMDQPKSSLYWCILLM